MTKEEYFVEPRRIKAGDALRDVPIGPWSVPMGTMEIAENVGRTWRCGDVECGAWSEERWERI